MPKCSSSYTTCGAMRHMYSIASWSPSQSEPLIVSYMCQSQLSSLMLPSEAPMPPCAATVCERVGNTFESTQTDRPARASCSEARIPEPPAPTMTTSKRRRGREFLIAGILLHSPENLRSVARTREQPNDRQRLQRETHTGGLHVIHPDVAHADPGVIEQREQRDEGRELHPLRGEDRCPAL